MLRSAQDMFAGQIAHHARKRPLAILSAFLISALYPSEVCAIRAPNQPDPARSAVYWLQRGLREADACPDAKQRCEIRQFLVQAAAQIGDDALLEHAISQSRADMILLGAGAPKRKGSTESQLSWSTASAYCKAGRFDAAQRIANEIKDSDSRRDALADVEYQRLKSLVDSIVTPAAPGNIKRVLEAVDNLPEDRRFRVIDELVAQLAYKDFAATVALIEKLPAGRKLGSDSGNLIRAGLLARDAKRVTEIVRTALDQIMKDPDDIRKAWEYDRLLGPLQLNWPADVPLVDEVRRRFVGELIGLAKRVGDPSAKQCVVRGLLTFGEFDAVQTAIAEASDDLSKADYTEQLARAQTARGKFDKTLELAMNGALTSERKAIVLEIVAEEQLKRGQLEAAQKTVSLIDPDQLSGFPLLSQIVQELLKVNDAATARRYVGRMPEAWEQVDGYCQIADHYAKRDQPELARKTLSQALSKAQAIEEEPTRSQAIQAVAQSTAARADFDQAIRIAQLVSMPNYRASTLLLLARRELEKDAKSNRGNATSCARLAQVALGEIADSKEGQAATIHVQVALLYHRLGDSERFAGAIRKALAAAPQARGAFWKYGAYGSVIGALHRTNQVHRMSELIDDIKQPLDRAVVCYVMAMLYAPAGPNNQVRERLQEAPASP